MVCKIWPVISWWTCVLDHGIWMSSVLNKAWQFICSARLWFGCFYKHLVNGNFMSSSFLKVVGLLLVTHHNVAAPFLWGVAKHLDFEGPNGPNRLDFPTVQTSTSLNVVKILWIRTETGKKQSHLHRSRSPSNRPCFVEPQCCYGSPEQANHTVAAGSAVCILHI